MSDIEKLTKALTDLLGKATGTSSTSSIDLKPPEPFDVSEPSKWPQWLRRFEVYRSASGLAKKEEDQQVNCFVYCLGSEADSLLTSIGLPSEKRETYEQVKKKFNDYFSVRKNLFYERTKFLQRVQGLDESVDSYINDLYRLVDKCEWACTSCSFHKDVLLVKLVSGLADRHLSTQLQLQKELTLDEAVLRIRQSVTIEKQQNAIRQSHSTFDNLNEQQPDVLKVVESNKVKLYKCSRCGRLEKSLKAHASVCPAKKSRCHGCKQVGHWRPFCPQNKRSSLNLVSTEVNDPKDMRTDSDSSDSLSYSLDTIYLASVQEKSNLFYTNVEVNGVPVNWKIDSGADVCVCGPVLAKELNLKVKPTSRNLRGAGNSKLSLKGVCKVTLRKNDVETQMDLFVVEGQNEPLLGRPAILTFQLLHLSVDHIDSGMEWMAKYPNVFNGLGVVKGDPYVIKLTDEAKPFSVSSPRRIPIPMKAKLKEELDRMVKSNIIAPVSEATDWCSPIVVASKKNGSIRLCVDYTELNKYVVRERLILPAVDELLTNMGSASVMSKLDAQSGFWQVVIDECSQKLTTFITPFGRFYFKRLPFGLTSAPEHFQKKMAEAIEGLEGVVNLVDDFLVYGKDNEEHDKRLDKLLKRLQQKGITLNKEKCEFKVSSLTFLGHRLENGQIKPDPDKVAAIEAVETPKNLKDLRSFLGMVNYLMKFIPHLSCHAAPLRTLLSEKYEWIWTDQHQAHFDKIKTLVSDAVSLVTFNPKMSTRICADSSSFGIGAVLEQQYTDTWQPVQFISRSLSEVERRYAQIEKEALALTWACERFSQYISGLSSFYLITDHLPLVEIFSNKPIDSLSARLQRFRMRMLPFTFKISHEKGKNFFIPDILSRNPLTLSNEENNGDILQEMEIHVCDVVSSINVTDRRLETLKKAQSEDPVCDLLKNAILTGEWVKLKNTPFYKERGNLVIHGDMILNGARIYVPREIRSDVLESIHKGHLGINKCMLKARGTVWWPGVANDIKRKVEGCTICIENSRTPCEPLISSPVPERPWQILGVDLLQHERKTYLVVQDYFSKYIELVQVGKTDALSLMKTLKSIFSRHGIPAVLRSDNSPFNSKEMRQFAAEYKFDLVTSSPMYPRSNGQAERAVQIAKNILKKNQDPYDGLLAYRSTPLECGYSPAELLFGRRIRSTVPISGESLEPKWPDLKKVKDWSLRNKEKQKRNYDSRHRTKDLRFLTKGEEVWVSNLKKYGKVLSFGTNNREYKIDVDGRVFRRNRIFLVPTNNRFHVLNEEYDRHKDIEEDVQLTPDDVRAEQNISRGSMQPKLRLQSHESVPQYTTRSGRSVLKPKRYVEEL